ncbi:LPS-assembly protein LptD [Candidatus Pelagibacter sp.]|uniref:LPS-assembly protein LptD n=1 Tax=Candidatus Pelagibacter sp. TaxID=2024849 RepID=UPI003F824F14
MKNKIFILICLFILKVNFVFANENIKFEAEKINTFDNGNTIIGEDSAVAEIDETFTVKGNKFIFYKLKNELVVEGDVIIINQSKNMEISSKKIIYQKEFERITAHNNVEVNDKENRTIINSNKIELDINNSLYKSFGNTRINFDQSYNIVSNDIFYDFKEKNIFSNKFTSFTDNLNNKITTTKFNYNQNLGTIDGENINLIDNDQNKYFLSIGKIDLNNQKLVGKDIKVNLRNDTFGNKQNNPKLVGNSINYNGDRVLIKKGRFTSCKDNEDCPPWSIVSDEIIHDKKKKEIHYKNAWINLYNKPVFYFPKFFHPDPTVDRRSGFLVPKFKNSSNLGSSVNIPYFQVISDSSDLTFKPRFFSETEYLLQSEYRKVTKNTSHILDFSFNKEKSNKNSGRKTHFFSNSSFNFDLMNFDESKIDLKIEKVSNDNYTKLYSLETTSPIIKNTNVLESIIEFTSSNDDLDFDLSFESYETMNKTNSDRYEFIYPNYNLVKNINFDDNFFENLNINSNGSQKKHKTNVYEGVQINDFLITSKEFENTFGFINNFEFLIKNVNSHGKNSSKFKDDEQSEVFSLFKYNNSFPLKKDIGKYDHFLTPKLSLKHSPNDTKNITNEERYLNIDNIFSINRIGFNETVESGSTLTLGIDYNTKDEKNKTLFNSSLASVFREKEDHNLPIKSTLNKKQSDIVGKLGFFPSEILDFQYNYSIDNDIDQFNLHRFENKFKVNNFVNNFVFYEENNIIGNNSYFENTFAYNFNSNNSLSFKTRENKKDNITEFYNLIYEYKNDCLTASIKYNKEYYTNNTLKPKEELFFNITLIPLGSTETESLID